MKKLLACLCLTLLCFAACMTAQAAAVPSAQNFQVDGKTVKTEIYNIDGNNYFKLRDIAMLLKGTQSGFSVDYDAGTGMISISGGSDYAPVGGELETGVDRSASCVASPQKLLVNGKDTQLKAYNIGGNNFFKLRDLGDLLSFYVGYREDTKTAVVLSSCSIRHTDYSKGMPADIYFEIPVFKGNSNAVKQVNQFFEDVEKQYAAGENLAYARELITGDLENGHGPTAENPYLAGNDAAVHSLTDSLISVSIDYSWFMGGVFDYGSNGYTFNAKTGDRLYLNDVLDGSDQQIKESIVRSLLQQYPGVENAGVMNTPMDEIRGMDIKEIDFIVSDSHVSAIFDKYEIAAGMAGMFVVTLPDALSAAFA